MYEGKGVSRTRRIITGCGMPISLGILDSRVGGEGGLMGCTIVLVEKRGGNELVVDSFR